MNNFEDCQFPLLHDISEGTVKLEPTSMKNRIKRLFANQWNHTVKGMAKRWLKRLRKWGVALKVIPAPAVPARPALAGPALASGDWVRIRSEEEIRATLDHWGEMKGCAFIQDMWQYCGTEQQVFKPVERFLDERDYKVKRVNGVVILKGLICIGTPVFERCDRACHLFWRTEWLEKIDGPASKGARQES